MKRDHYRDTATLAFWRFGLLRNKSAEEYITENNIEREQYKGFCEDLFAVSDTLLELAATKREYIVEAVREIYMCSRKYPDHKDIACRVRRYALMVPATEKTVYKWLEVARNIYALKRGLAIDTPPGFGDI